MTKEEELKKLRKEEQVLLSQLNGLRETSNDLKENPEKQEEQKRVDNIIVARQNALAEVRNDIKSLEGNELVVNERARKLETKEAIALVLESGLAVTGMLSEHRDWNKEVEKMMNQQPPAIEIVVQNPSPETMGYDQAIKDIMQKFEDKTQQAYEPGTDAKTDKTKDAAKEWEKDIAAKEAPIQEERTRQLQNLETNTVWQEVYLKETKKDGYEEKLKQLEIDKEKATTAIEENFKKQMEPIENEKKALKEAIDSTKDMAWEERNREIERQRKEFEKQQELERQKEKEKEKVL